MGKKFLFDGYFAKKGAKCCNTISTTLHTGFARKRVHFTLASGSKERGVKVGMGTGLVGGGGGEPYEYSNVCVKGGYDCLLVYSGKKLKNNVN